MILFAFDISHDWKDMSFAYTKIFGLSNASDIPIQPDPDPASRIFAFFLRYKLFI